MRRSRPARPVLAAILFVLGIAPALAGGNANFLLGPRNASDGDFWGEEDDQMVAGIMVDFGREGWPIHICLSNMDSISDDDGVTGQISEYAVGVMKVWEPRSSIRPYVGGGIALVQAAFVIDVSAGELVQHDSTSGFYVDGGVFWRTGKRFNIGFGARFMTQASVDIEGFEGDADYAQVHLLAGWGWPRRER